MLKFKPNPFSSKEIIREIEGSVKLNKIFEDYCEEYKIPPELHDAVKIYVNGMHIEKDFWQSISCSEKDDVLVTTVPKGGESRSIFRAIIPTVLAIVATAFVPQGSAAWWTAAAAAAGTTIGVLLTNAFLPPITPSFNLGALGEISESQMYSLNSQGNRVAKYGFVPKVYGTHRMFPNVAANPYLELEPDPSTGELAQYLYVIYDFGLGPLSVSDLRIGGNPLENYSEVSYRLVDFNKPAVSEGFWDDMCSNFLDIYRGDNDPLPVGVTLNGNKVEGGPSTNYQVIREASSLIDGSSQEITVNFTAPAGLISFATTGERGSSTISFSIEFAPIGTTDWKSFDDPNVVNSWSSTKGEIITNPSLGAYAKLEPAVIHTGGLLPFPEVKNYDVIERFRYPHARWLFEGGTLVPFSNLVTFNMGKSGTSNPPRVVTVDDVFIRQTIGYAAGRTSIVARTAGVPLNSIIRYGQTVLGKVLSITPVDSEYSTYTFYDPIPTTVIFMSVINLFDDTVGVGQFQNNIWGTPGAYYWGGSINVSPNNFPNNSPSEEILSTVLNYLPPISPGISGTTQRPIYGYARFSPKNSNVQYKIRLTRISTLNQYSYQDFNDLQVTSINTRFLRTPIVTTKRHLFLEMRIKSTNQLNGSLDVISGVVASALKVYDGSVWAREITNNPAWVFADLITGEVNKKALPLTRLDTDSLLEWATFCDEIPPDAPNNNYTQKRFQCNFVLDFPDTLQGVLNKVTLNYQASLNILDAKYGVLIDKLKNTPVQIFTPRNSWGFSSTRQYVELPHGFKVKYVDPQSNWELNEVIVYTDGYDATNAEEFEELDVFGCTTDEQAYRYGRYMIAQAVLRQENITIEVDFENLVCTRGDYVKYTHDVMRVGGTPARVRSVSGIRITIDDAVVTVPGAYGYTSRSSLGVIVTDTLTVIDSQTFDLAGTMPAVGDLIVIGPIANITIDCLVKSITPSGEFNATLVLVEKADAVYTAESDDDVPVYSPQLAPNTDTEVSAPDSIENLVVEENSYDCAGAGYLYFISLSWAPPVFGAVDKYEIYVNVDNRGYDLWDFSSPASYIYIVQEEDLDLEHKFKVLGVASNGRKINLGQTTQEVAATPATKLVPPEDVESLSINITNEVMQLNWTRVDQCDIAEYLIRFVPVMTGGTWETSSPLLRVDARTSTSSVQARVGTYLIKAVDFNGNESLVAAEARTSIPGLFNLNIIEETTDFPSLPGNLVDTETLGTSILLKKVALGPPEQYVSEGYYYFSELLDLGEIFTVRLQALIQAEGFTLSDLMSEWVTLDDVDSMSSSEFSDWSVDAQYRSTAVLNTIDTWTLLSDIEAMSTGDDDVWTPWTDFTMGDFTGRIFQFRLRLRSLKPSVTPLVFNAVIRSDMADRVASFAGVTVPNTGYTLVYDPPFYGPATTPVIGVTQNDSSQGDYFQITDKTLEGFTITFYDKDNNPVERSADFMVKGHGYKNDEVI